MENEKLLEKLTILIQSRDDEGLVSFIIDHPSILDMVDRQGVNGFTQIAYSGLVDAFITAKKTKVNYSFHEAIISGNIEKVKEWIKGGNDMNEYSADGFTPVALACYFGQEKVVEHLLKIGADPDLSATNPSKVNALHAAVANNNSYLCEVLIDHGANVNKPQTQNVTPLHAAVHRGNIEIVRLLLKSGADANIEMDSGDTAVMIAEKEGRDEILDLLTKL